MGGAITAAENINLTFEKIYGDAIIVQKWFVKFITADFLLKNKARGDWGLSSTVIRAEGRSWKIIHGKQ